MDRKPKPRKILGKKQLKSVKGGSLNPYVSKVTGEKQGSIAPIKEISGLKMETDVVDL